MQLARIPYLVCGASKLQLYHPLNKRLYIPPWTSEKSQFHLDSERTSIITTHIGIHNESESLNLKASYFEIIDTIQSEVSHRFMEFNMSLIKFLRARLPGSNGFLDREELQPLCSLVNSTTKRISEDLDAETTIVKSIVWSMLPDVLLNENIPMNLDQQFLKCFWKYKAAFPPLYLLLSAGLSVGVSTATCEASFSSVVRILTSYRRCMTHKCTDQGKASRQFKKSPKELKLAKQQLDKITSKRQNQVTK